jgi:hypothetical protein
MSFPGGKEGGLLLVQGEGREGRGGGQHPVQQTCPGRGPSPHTCGAAPRGGGEGGGQHPVCNTPVLLVEVVHVRDEVLHHVHVGQHLEEGGGGSAPCATHLYCS